MTTDKPLHYKDLIAWQKSMSLTKRVYRVTDRFSPDEKFGLVTQLRRAAVSIPLNIAEGQARRRTMELVRFIRTPKDPWPKSTHSWCWELNSDFAMPTMFDVFSKR